MPYITPADLKGSVTQFISAQGTSGVDFTLYSDTQLTSLISCVSNEIDGFCRQTFQLTNIQERYMGRGTNILRLRRYPLAQIPDSVFGGSGQVSQSLVCDTTTTAPVAKGHTSVPVADASDFVAGQYLQWGDGSGETGIGVTAVTASTIDATGTLTLKSGLAYAHDSGARVVVNTLDFIDIVLPGQSIYPIPISQLVVDAEKGLIINYTPLMFQNLGYATIFPNMLPLLARYTYGFRSGQVPPAFQDAVIEQCRRTVLRYGNLAAQGVKQWRIDDQSMTFADWKPAPLEADLMEQLGPYRRNVGFA